MTPQSLGRLYEALTMFEIAESDEGTQEDISRCSEGAMLASGRVPDVLHQYVESVTARHADCPDDCYLPGLHYSAELLLCAQTLEREQAQPQEQIWRDDRLPREQRLDHLGQWSTWVVLGGVIAEPKPVIIANGGRVSSLIRLLTSMGEKWPEICAAVYEPLIQITVPDDARGLDA